MAPSMKLKRPQPASQAPQKILADQGTSLRPPARSNIQRPSIVITHTDAWKMPSHIMLTLASTRLVGGSQPDSMLCHCRIWWNTMPSTKPPMPAPIRTPAARSGLRLMDAAMLRIVRAIEPGCQCDQHRHRQEHQRQPQRELRIEHRRE